MVGVNGPGVNYLLPRLDTGSNLYKYLQEITNGVGVRRFGITTEGSVSITQEVDDHELVKKSLPPPGVRNLRTKKCI